MLGTNATITLTTDYGALSGFLFIGFPSRNGHLDLNWASTIYVELTLPVAMFPLNTGPLGTWSVVGSIPNDNSLIGERLMLQAGYGPTGNPPLYADLTNGLLLTFDAN